MMTGSAELLRLEAVSKSYTTSTARRVEVVSDVTLAVHAGEVLGLTGPSGSGKSSVVRISGLLTSVDRGEVVLRGVPVDRRSRRDQLRRESLGIVFQGGNLFPELTILQNVAIASKSADLTRAKELISQFDLSDVMHSLGKEVSGGQAQRAALCRAMMNRPQIILADEPTAGLDAVNADRVTDALREAREAGCAVLLATHDPAILDIADRVVRMEGGRVL